MQSDSVEAGKRYVIVDDLLATGGSLHAGCKLITDLKGIVVECLVVIELTALEVIIKIISPFSLYQSLLLHAPSLSINRFFFILPPSLSLIFFLPSFCLSLRV